MNLENRYNIMLYNYIIISFIFLLICLPNSFKENLSIELFDISFFPISLMYIPIIFYSLKKKISKLDIAIYLFILLVFLTNFVSEDKFIQRFILAIQFFYPFFIIKSIKINDLFIKQLRILTIFAFIFISFQVIFGSLGIIKFNTMENDEVGGIFRIGTTAGVATSTAPLLLMLYALIYQIFDNKKMKFFFYILLVISIFLTGTRSSLIILIISSLLYVIFTLNFKQKILSIIFILITFIFFNYKYDIIGIIESRNENAKEYSNGDITSGRLVRISKVLKVFEENPTVVLTGIGGANTPYFNRYKNTSMVIDYSPHNVYLSILLEHGIFSLLIFIYVIYIMSKKILKKRDISSFIIIGIFIFCFNTEVVPRHILLSSLVFINYFVIIYKKNQVKNNGKNNIY